jgi:selenide,water dikinase
MDNLSAHPVCKDLVLLGGGHAHVIVIRKFGMKPLPGIRLTLISDASYTPYSGMLPGHVAGIYDEDDCHIDLRRLAEFAKVQFVVDRAIGLDLENNWVICAHHPAIAFDVLSIDIGSTPTVPAVAGCREYGMPVKPVSQFLEHWHQFCDQGQARLQADRSRSWSVGIIGGGAGGVELALAMRSRLATLANDPQALSVAIHLFDRQSELLPHHNRWVRYCLHRTLRERGIQLHLGQAVQRLVPIPDAEQVYVHPESGLPVVCDQVFWVTQASAPEWLRESGLAVDPYGFVQVSTQLQSVSHPQVFAAGDIATIVNAPCPKAGVFAVRQGNPLAHNLRQHLLGKKLQSYRPQTRYLSLIGVGQTQKNQRPSAPAAIVSWGVLGWGPSMFIWRWKDWLDRSFMKKFSDLPQRGRRKAEGRGQKELENLELRTQNSEWVGSVMPCAGCASKVGSTTLERVLQRLPAPLSADHVLIGLDVPDDAAVVRVPADRVMVHTVDFFRALVADPFVFGQISANHCLSDLFAMGATPQSALAIATVPYGLPAQQEETLYQLLAGARQVLDQSQTPLVGGHTTEGPELVFGLSCNGLANPNQLLRKGGMQPGQVLVLTKALGTGTLFAAHMRLQAKARWLDRAIASMVLSNQAAATCLVQHQAVACTDVTGFGLLGHLLEMLRTTDIAIELDLAALPILPGAQETIQHGMVSSLQSQNLQVAGVIQNFTAVSHHPMFPLLFDPQTSGGLLAAIPAENAPACLAALQVLGYPDSRIIGRVLPRMAGIQPVRILSVEGA